jgi:hypothetical protein
MTNLFETADFGTILDEWLGERLNPHPVDCEIHFQDEDELIPSVSTRFFVSEMFVHLPNLQAKFDAYAEKSGGWRLQHRP